VLGCLAHGGLAGSTSPSTTPSPTVGGAQGLLTPGTPTVCGRGAERQFLAEVEHPNMLKIHNFVQHREPGSETATATS